MKNTQLLFAGTLLVIIMVAVYFYLTKSEHIQGHDPELFGAWVGIEEPHRLLRFYDNGSYALAYEGRQTGKLRHWTASDGRLKVEYSGDHGELVVAVSDYLVERDYLYIDSPTNISPSRGKIYMKLAN